MVNKLMKSKNPLISVVIRTRNEGPIFKELLTRLKKQTFSDFEIVIVDSQSTDNTRNIAKKHGCRIALIKQEKFTYAYSMNVGCEKARGKYILLTVGHALPLRKDWIEIGLSEFKDRKTAGVYALPLSNKRAKTGEKLIGLINKRQGRIIYQNLRIPRNALMWAVGCMFPKDLWQKHHFDERIKKGGEDTAWGNYWIRKGYKIVREPKFAVAHSHGLKGIDFIKEVPKWLKMRKDAFSSLKKDN